MKKNLSTYLVIGFTIVAMMVSLYPFKAVAISPSTISVDISPENPAAGESTTITLSSYASNLDSTLITWYVNGKKSTSGIGVKSFTAIAPQAGGESTVRALISLPDGEIEKKIVLRPSVMTLLYEASDSYVPPFYKGKALPSTDSTIKVVAMPEIKSGSSLASPKNLLYSWKLNYNNAASDSGYGKNYFYYVGDYLENSDNIGVTVSTVDGQGSAQANISIAPSQPEIAFYKNDTYLGTLWEQALASGHKITGDEIIVAEPYFISPKVLWNPSLVWKWFINGNQTNNTLTYNKNWLPIKVEGGATGTSTLRVEVESKNQFLENASKELDVNF